MADLVYYQIFSNVFNIIVYLLFDNIMVTKTSEFRDPIYQFIHVNDYEQRLIETKPFQRLRYIHQLGLSYLIYPGATHTRFEHSLGTMEIGSKLFDILCSKNNIFLKQKTGDGNKGIFEDEKEIKKYRQIFRIACLLHDIGHHPFSHASESIWDQDHETMGSEIILSNPIRKKIENYPGMEINAEDVAFVATKKPIKSDAKLQFLIELLQGDLGVDRIDYLIRDSLHTGVLYGVFDYHRLLDTFTVYLDEENNPRLGLESGGIHAAEGLILARYFMFLQVYFHKTRSIYDKHLGDYLKYFLKQAKIRGVDYNKIENYVELNDYDILHQMSLDMKKSNRSKGTILAKMILERGHYRLAREIDGSLFPEEVNPNEVYEEIENEIRTTFKKECSKHYIIFDKPGTKTEKFEQANFNIFDEDTQEFVLILKKSKLIESLKNIDLFRIYIKRGKIDSRIRNDVKRIIGDIEKKYKYVKKGENNG